MAEVRLCSYCGKPMVKRDGDSNHYFRTRKKFCGLECAILGRKKTGWHKNTERGNGLPTKRCKKCGLIKIRLRRNGFGIKDSKQFCICDREYNEGRGAYV